MWQPTLTGVGLVLVAMALSTSTSRLTIMLMSDVDSVVGAIRMLFRRCGGYEKCTGQRRPQIFGYIATGRVGPRRQ